MEDQWGSQLLREALETILASVDLGGGQVIVVDADNPALVGWYSRHGFKSTGSQPLRLYMKVATARRYLEQE
jgi:ribosomal protein S18 acetylase RimI-like enzyme